MIALDVLRLNPHIALIFGSVFRSIELSCVWERNDCPKGNSTEGLNTVLYIIIFSARVQFHLSIQSTIVKAFTSILDAWMDLSPLGVL